MSIENLMGKEVLKLIKDSVVKETDGPTFTNDLKHGANSSGAIGLWVDVGTEGFFSDLKIQKGK